MKLVLHRVDHLKGATRIPGDKSITHRALLLSALSEGSSRIRGHLQGGDCAATISCLRDLGISIQEKKLDELIVHGKGLYGWQEPNEVLNCQRSGTTMRLLAGALAGQSFYSIVSGDPQLRRRPMDRITQPLQLMGAEIWGRQGGRLPPLSINGSPLRGIDYNLPIASAQVKSCLLLAAMYASGESHIIEPGPSRDHTERMLRARGVELVSQELAHQIEGPVTNIKAIDTDVPGDFSSAAYLAVAASLLTGSEITIWNVGINPTRTGLLDVLTEMSAEIILLNKRDQAGEPVADLWVRSHELKATAVGGDLVPRMIDEFPILALAATQANGITRVSDAAELRVKETDRVATTVDNLRLMGAKIEAAQDGFIIEGPTPLHGADVDSCGDHRLGMTLAIAALIAEGETRVARSECIADSFPGFIECLDGLAEESLR